MISIIIVTIIVISIIIGINITITVVKLINTTPPLTADQNLDKVLRVPGSL